MNSAIHNKKVFVARNCTRTSGITSSNVASKLAYGEIVVLSKTGSIIDTAAKAQAAEAIRLMIGTKDKAPIISDLIYKKSLKKVLSSKFKQKAEPRQYIGFNGTSGSIDTVSGNTYAIELETFFGGRRDTNRYLSRVSYESKLTGATQFNIANNLALLLGLEMEQFDEGIRINIVSDQAGAAAVTGGEVINRSRSVSYTGGTPPAVGQTVVIPGLTGSTFRNEDDTLYLVTYVDATNKFFELDREYSNRNQSGLAINVIADTTVGNYGLSLESEEIIDNTKYNDLYMVNFDLTLFEFGDTILTKDGILAMDEGFGRHENVKNREFTYGDGEGRNIYYKPEYQNVNINTDDGTGYSLVTVVFDRLSSPNLLDTHSVPKEVDVYLQRGTYADIAADAAGTALSSNIQTGTGLSGVDGDSFLNVINAFAVGAGVLATGANTVSNGGKEITAATTYSTGLDV